MNQTESTTGGTTTIALGERNMDASTPRLLTGKENCEASSCAESAVIALAGQDFCLHHFLAKCYERLGLLESMVHAHAVDSAWVRTARALLQECSNQTLRVSLRHQPLSNLERSRLLDILLLCGELQQTLRNPLFGFGELNARDSTGVFSESSDRKES